MNCAQFESQLVDIAAGRSAANEGFRRHLVGCDECRLRLPAERRLTFALRDLANELNWVTVPTDIEQRLMARFHAGQRSHSKVSITPVKSAARLRGDFSRWAVTSAIAAVVMLCLTVVAKQSLRIGNLTTARAVATHRAPAPSTPEITTPFYRVYAGGIRVASSRGLVRVKVPRATLAVFGLPFNPRRADAPITADLLVDNIGMVTAMRFVQ